MSVAKAEANKDYPKTAFGESNLAIPATVIFASKDFPQDLTSSGKDN